MLQQLGIEFGYIDVDRNGGAPHVLSALKSSHKLPEGHSTIPVIYDEGKFLGGFTDLVESLRLTHPALEKTLEDIDATAQMGQANFSKFGHTLSASLTGWRLLGDYIIAENAAELTLIINMNSKEDVHIFAVVSFENKELETKRHAAYAKVKDKDTWQN